MFRCENSIVCFLILLEVHMGMFMDEIMGMDDTWNSEWSSLQGREWGGREWVGERWSKGGHELVIVEIGWYVHRHSYFLNFWTFLKMIRNDSTMTYT